MSRWIIVDKKNVDYRLINKSTSCNLSDSRKSVNQKKVLLEMLDSVPKESITHRIYTDTEIRTILGTPEWNHDRVKPGLVKKILHFLL